MSQSMTHFSLAELKSQINADEWKLKSSLFYFEYYERNFLICFISFLFPKPSASDEF